MDSVQVQVRQMHQNTDENGDPGKSKEVNVYIRKQKTLIVGPKKGITAFLAGLAACGIVILKLLAPLSTSLALIQFMRFLLYRRTLLKSRHPRKRSLAIWAIIEAVFYGYMKMKERSLQKRCPEKAPRLSKTERQILFERCIHSSFSPRHFVESWFEPVVPYDELGRENVEELLAWAMFHSSEPNSLSDSEKEELNWMVSEVERRAGPFASGKNVTARILKFDQEPVTGQHRPLVMYLVVHILFQVVMAPLQMAWAGYKRNRQGTVPYYYRPGRNPNLPPICLIHGMGIGILPYQNFLRLLERLCDADTGGLAGRGIFIPEIQVISQQLNPSELHCDKFIPDVRTALKKCSGHEVMCVVGHSYGTFLVSWLVKHAPDMVGAIGLIDPPAILLHNTEVLHNIVYHKTLPNAVEMVLDYILRSELTLVHNLKREFFWYKNILFFEEIDTRETPTFVVLGDTDQVVPIYEIKNYIERYNRGEYVDVPNAPHKPASTIDLLWFKNCDHSGFLFDSSYELKVAEAIGRVCEKSNRMQAWF